MKKLLLLSMLAFMPMLMLAGVTVYVQSEAAPNLYVWNADGQAINGQWPGTAMSQTVAMDGVTYYAATFEAEKINLILNNAAGQTSDITNIIDDVVLSYSGGSDFSDVTQQVLYGENLSLPEQAAFVTGKQFCYLLTDNLAAPMAYAWNGEGEVTAAYRARYAKLLGDELWEHDIKVKTLNGGKTIEFVGGIFAANKNIKDFQEKVYGNLVAYGYTRSQYKWIEHDTEYTYFDIK